LQVDVGQLHHGDFASATARLNHESDQRLVSPVTKLVQPGTGGDHRLHLIIAEGLVGPGDEAANAVAVRLDGLRRFALGPERQFPGREQKAGVSQCVRHAERYLDWQRCRRSRAACQATTGHGFRDFQREMSPVPQSR
jgi:hypothetical protein